MSWTVTARGINGNYTGSQISSISVTVSGITAGHSLAVFSNYGPQVGGTEAITCTDNQSNSYTLVDNNSDADGQAFGSFWCSNVGTAPTSITVSYPNTTALVAVAAVEFSNSASGTPTLHGHSTTVIATAATSFTSGSTTSTNGDLVIAGLNVTTSLGTLSAGTITGATSTIGNNNGTTYAQCDESGTTTASSVTAAFSTSASSKAIINVMTFSPPAAAPAFIPRPRPYRPVIIPVKLWQR